MRRYRTVRAGATCADIAHVARLDSGPVEFLSRMMLRDRARQSLGFQRRGFAAASHGVATICTEIVQTRSLGERRSAIPEVLHI